MWPDRVSNPRPLTYESGALSTALRGPASEEWTDGQTDRDGWTDKRTDGHRTNAIYPLAYMPGVYLYQTQCNGDTWVTAIAHYVLCTGKLNADSPAEPCPKKRGINANASICCAPPPSTPFHPPSSPSTALFAATTAAKTLIKSCSPTC